MTAGEASPSGAVSREPLEWHSLSWKAIQRNVRRLQVRIVKATHIRIATGGFIAWESLWGNRVLLSKAFERLEPCDGRLSRTVLRGLGGSNAPRLPGRRRG